MPNITRNGLTIDSLNDVYSFLESEYKRVYGSDIIVDQDTPDGQIIGIISKLNADAQEALLRIYNSFDPDSAIGVELNKLIKLSGINRRPTTKSKVDMDIVANTAVTITTNYEAVDDLGQIWIPQQEYNLTVGTNSVIFESQDFGAIQAGANTITEQGTIFLQIDSLTNPAPASIGVDEETDEQLRIRRNRSLEKPSLGSVGGLQAELLQLNNVVDAIVYENDTDVTDTTRDIPAHHIWTIVDGGLNSDIGQTIIREKTAGAGMKGDITETFTQEFLRQDGSTRIQTYSAKFDRPTDANIYITLDVTPKISGDVIDTALIKEKIATKSFFIAEDLTVTELYAFVYQAGTNFIATNLQASKDNITFTAGELDADFAEKFNIDTTNITVTEV